MPRDTEYWLRVSGRRLLKIRALEKEVAKQDSQIAELRAEIRQWKDLYFTGLKSANGGEE